MKNRTVLWVLFSITLTMLIIVTTGLIYFYPGRSVLRPLLATFDSDKVTVRIIPQIPAASTRKTTSGSVIIDGMRADLPEIDPELEESDETIGEVISDTAETELVEEPIVEVIEEVEEVLEDVVPEVSEVVDEQIIEAIIEVVEEAEVELPLEPVEVVDKVFEPENPIENIDLPLVVPDSVGTEVGTPDPTDERNIELETPEITVVALEPEPETVPVESVIVELEPEPVEPVVEELVVSELEPEPVETVVEEPVVVELEPEPVEPVVEELVVSELEPEPVEPVVEELVVSELEPEPIFAEIIETELEPGVVENIPEEAPIEETLVETNVETTEEPVLVEPEPEPEPELEPEELFYKIPTIEPRYWTVAGIYPTVNKAELGLNLLQKSGLSGTIAVLSNQEFQLRLGPYGTVEQAIAMKEIVNNISGFKNTAAVKITIPR